jgi:hypothetical protein
MLKTRLLNVLLVFGLFVPGLAMAQYGSADQGQYSILSAQYGTSARHVDVTNRLRELAQSDRSFRMGNSTFGVDPAPGERKVLHIFARGPNGQERMFEYPEGSTVDGAQFRGWGHGDWGRGGWSGHWEGQNPGYQGQNPGYQGQNPGYQGQNPGYERQPQMEAAMQNLRQAQQNLQSASTDKGGHREKALEYINRAIAETQAGIQYANRH